MKPTFPLFFVLLFAGRFPLFAVDDVWFADTRPGTVALSRLETNRWETTTDQEFLDTFDADVPLIVVVHGNWMSRTEAKSYGLLFHSLSRNADPHRLLIWSWPSEKMDCRIRRDAQIKAVRADAQSEYLLAFLRSLPAESKVSLIGFSYGAKLICSTLQHSVDPSEQIRRVRAVLLAAAMDQGSLRPGGKYGDALQATEKLLVHVNPLDSTLRFYPLLYGCGGPEAVGKAGVNRNGLSAESAAKIKSVNVSRMIGREHGTKESLTTFLAYPNDFKTYALFLGD